MKKNHSRIRKPVMKWQTGDYQQSQTITFDFPQQLLMICKLTGITPLQLLLDFIDNISCGSWNREGRDKVKHLLSEYFIEHGYGKPAYSNDELRNMFKELDAVGLLFPRDAAIDVLDAYSSWRQKHQGYWFDKWSR